MQRDPTPSGRRDEVPASSGAGPHRRRHAVEPHPALGLAPRARVRGRGGDERATGARPCRGEEPRRHHARRHDAGDERLRRLSRAEGEGDHARDPGPLLERARRRDRQGHRVPCRGSGLRHEALPGRRGPRAPETQLRLRAPHARAPEPEPRARAEERRAPPRPPPQRPRLPRSPRPPRRQVLDGKYRRGMRASALEGSAPSSRRRTSSSGARSR